jgi:gliding motility-associated-like protein
MVISFVKTISMEKKNTFLKSMLSLVGCSILFGLHNPLSGQLLAGSALLANSNALYADVYEVPPKAQEKERSVSNDASDLFGGPRLGASNIYTDCDSYGFESIVLSHFKDYDPHATYIQQLSADVSYKWNLPLGSVIVNVEVGPENVAHGYLSVIDGHPLTFTFSGTYPVKVWAKHSPFLMSHKREGIIAIDNTVYVFQTSLPSHIQHVRENNNYYVENTSSTDLTLDQLFSWKSVTTAEGITFFTNSTASYNKVYLFIKPECSISTVVIVDDVASTEVDTPVEIDILGNDSGIPEDGTLTVTDPSNGTVTVNDNGTPNDLTDDTVTYVPDAGFEGTDSFEYTVCDATGNCGTGTVTVTVGTPEALDVVDDVASTEVGTPVEIDILGNDSGIPEDGTLTVTDPSNGTVTVNDNGTPNDLTDDTVTYVPDAGFEGTDSFEYTVCDATGNCGTGTVTVTVGTPEALNVVDDVASTEVDTPVEIDILGNDSGIPEDGTLTVTDPSNGTVTVNDNGTPNDLTDDTVTYVPDAGFEGTDSFEYTVCDATGNCGTGTVTVTVGTPEALNVVDDVASTEVDTPVEIDILGNDSGIPEDGTLTVTDPSNGTVTVNDNGTPNDLTDDTVTYVPDAGFEGTDSFEYTVCDATGNCGTGTVTVTVGTPEALDVVDDVASTEVGTPVEVDVLANDSGIPTDGTLTVTDPSNGTVTVNDNGTPNDLTDDTVTYVPDAGFEGTDSFEYTVCDATGNCGTGTVTVTVGTPEALDVVDDVASTEVDTPVEIDILGNDSGIPEDGTLTVTDPSNGTVTVNDNGTPNDLTDDTVTYVPDAGFEGTDSFEYTVCDATGNCGTGTVTVTVGTPEALNVVDDVASTEVDTPVEIDILSNDTGIPSDGTLTFTDPSDGVIVINDNDTPDDIRDDSIAYIPDAGFQGVDSLEYTVCDQMGTCATATVTITVGTPPILDAVDDNAATPAGVPVDIAILDNDSNVPPNGSFTVEQPADGAVEVNDNGTTEDITDDFVTYTPNPGFEGIDTFEYTLCDASGFCDTATVSIEVSAPQISAVEVNQMLTPNNDGRNDFLFIRGLDTVRSNKLRIFNRWGVAVYEGENYNNQNNVFDGRSRGRSTLSVDDYLPSGVYFYIFDYVTLDGEMKTDSEYIYISR